MITERPNWILRVIRLMDHDPDHILALLEEPSYLRDESTDLQFSFCKRKLMLYAPLGVLSSFHCYRIIIYHALLLLITLGHAWSFDWIKPLSLSLLYAQCGMFNVQSSMFNAQCSMLNAQCSMLNAQCSMLNAQCSWTEKSYHLKHQGWWPYHQCI